MDASYTNFEAVSGQGHDKVNEILMDSLSSYVAIKQHKH